MEKDKTFEHVTYRSSFVGIPHLPFKAQRHFIPKLKKTAIFRKPVEVPPLSLPGSDLPRVLNYVADFSGCGLWRIGAPEFLLNYNQKIISTSLTTMVLDPRFYLSGFKAIKLQRQATPFQKEFVKFLKEMGSKLDSKLIYEVDDIVFHEDIPEYNRCRVAFTDPEIRKSITDIIEMCDEVLVCSEYMKEYYKSKTNNKKVVYIPNYAPKMWFDRYYNEDVLLKRFEKNKKRPRILMTGSGTHFDVVNATGQKDDYTHVVQSIIDTRKDFKWCWLGGYPLLLKPFIDNGDMEFINWSPLMEFANTIYNCEAQVTMAALADNHFNRSKSWIKFTESSCFGIPFVGQDLNPYKDSYHKFVTGDEMIDQIKTIVKSEKTYMDECKKHRKFADGIWLDDHLDQHIAMYTTKYGDEERKKIAPLLAKNNSEQFLIAKQ
jgi:hypothetical protein